jgi:hypothetical protein
MESLSMRLERAAPIPAMQNTPRSSVSGMAGLLKARFGRLYKTRPAQ